MLKAFAGSLKINPELSEQIATLGSQVSLELCMLAIILSAAFVLEPQEFVWLTLANGYITTCALILDFGLNQTCLKLSVEKGDSKYVDLNVLVKAAVFLAAIAIFLITTIVYGPLIETVVLAGSAGMAFWASTRMVEQYHRRFWRYAALNFALTGSRIVFAGAALLTQSWVLIVMSIHVIAQLPVHVTTVRGLVQRWRSIVAGVNLSEFRSVSGIAPPMFFHTLLHTSLPLITQTAIFLNASSSDAGSFGIVMLFISGQSLIATTMRIYILPQVLTGRLNAVDVFGMGRGSFHIVVAAFAIFFIIGAIPLGIILTWLYEDRYPQIGMFLLIYFSAQTLTTATGFYNMRALRKNLIWIALSMSVLRAALFAPMLFMPQLSAITIVSWSGAVLLAGELAAALLLTWAGRRKTEDD